METTQLSQLSQELGDKGNTNQSPVLKEVRFRKFVFTLNNWTEQEFVSMSQYFEKKGFKYIIGKEVGESGTPHLQGYVDCNGKQIRFSTLKNLNNRLHIEKAKGNRQQNIEYCSKDEDYVSTFELPLKQKILKKYYEGVKWKPWQQDIIDICNSTPDSRTINWFWERKGNIGKSFLSKYIAIKYNAIIGGGKKADVFNQINTWMEANKDKSPEVVIVDLSRGDRSYINYPAIESIKNGMLYSGKYEGGVCYFDHPHVIVFANFEPEETALSKDRWNIVQIKG